MTRKGIGGHKVLAGRPCDDLSSPPVNRDSVRFPGLVVFQPPCHSLRSTSRNRATECPSSSRCWSVKVISVTASVHEPRRGRSTSAACMPTPHSISLHLSFRLVLRIESVIFFLHSDCFDVKDLSSPDTTRARRPAVVRCAVGRD